MAKYPSPDSLDLPAAPRRSPDQKYYVGWVVQHNRLWFKNAVQIAINAVLVGLLFMQTAKYKPAVQLVTIDGRPVTASNGNTIIVGDSLEYSPPRVRALARSFIEARWAYDWEKPTKIYEAFRLMDAEAEGREKAKLAQNNWYQNVVIGTQAKVRLVMNYDDIKVQAVDAHSFKLEVSGNAYINTKSNPAPNPPVVKPVTLSFIVTQVAETDDNLLGYVVVATDPESIL